MINNSSDSFSNSTDDKQSFTEKFLEAIGPPSEERIYQSYFNRDFWTIDEFSALIAGLTPENYKNGTKGTATVSDLIFSERMAFANKIFGQFLDDLEKSPSVFLDEVKKTPNQKEFIITENFGFLSCWKFIKWIALNDIPMKRRFFEALPLILKELYVEFQPFAVALRTKSYYSRAYHEALYLEHAKVLLDESTLTPKELYDHPRMQNVLRTIRGLEGHYTKRTILESWLPKVIECKRGRPRKGTSIAK